MLVAGAGCSQGAEYRPEALVRRRRLGSKRQGMSFFFPFCVCVCGQPLFPRDLLQGFSRNLQVSDLRQGVQAALQMEDIQVTMDFNTKLF